MSHTFSIAMCTYNGARYLREQLESIAAQTRPPDQLVICDDQSTDDTTSIVNEYIARVHFPVQLQINERNLGSTKNFERALQLCSGDLIALCDQDDVWSPQKLAVLETEFERQPKAGLIFSDAVIIGDDGETFPESLWQKLPIPAKELQRLQGKQAIDDLLAGSTITGATMAFRARFKELLLPIPDDLPVIHDGWIAMLVSAVSQIVPLETPLMMYRHHSAQQVGAKERVQPRPGIKEAVRRETSFDDLLAIGTRLQQRLVECQEQFPSDKAQTRLAARLDHLRMRGTLPERSLSRFSCVLKELLTGRYHAYSRGVSSAVKDIFRSGTQH